MDIACKSFLTQSQRQKSLVSYEQRESLLDFLCNNPEMLTHSSTKENEAQLWKDLTVQLNALQPEKTVEFWKRYLKQWEKKLFIKPENTLTLLDYRMKKFLYHLGIKTEEITFRMENEKNLSLEEIDEKLKNIEKEKVKNMLSIDYMSMKVHRYKQIMSQLKNSIALKKQRNRTLISQKAFYLDKRTNWKPKIKQENINSTQFGSQSI